MSHKQIIPYGYCHCGCGSKTRIAAKTNHKRGYVKGQHIRFADSSHAARKHRPPIRYGKIDNEPVAYIPLTQGKWAIVDRGKLYLVKDGVWYYSNGYACQERDGKLVKMHNVIMPPPEGLETDHIFGKTLDNRVSQLRTCKHILNCRNQGLAVNNTSGYKGVSWHKATNNWRVSIGVDGLWFHIGYFSEDQLIEAAKAYDVAAIKYHGEYARLNFPEAV